MSKIPHLWGGTQGEFPIMGDHSLAFSRVLLCRHASMGVVHSWDDLHSPLVLHC